jgi:hypothetical protein
MKVFILISDIYWNVPAESPLQIFSVRLFSSAIFKPTRRKPTYSPDPARLVSDSGTKAAPLLGSGNRGLAKEMSQLHFPFYK